MKTVVVAGAAGGIGEGIVRALLAVPGTKVIATSRDPQRLAALQQRVDPALRERLTPLVGDAGDFAGAAALVGQVEALGGADAGVALLGRGWWTSGPLLELPPPEWSAILAEMLTAHFAFARAIVPLLATRPQSLYLAIGGGAAFAPMLDAGLVSVAAAGQLMLTRVLARERGDEAPRICELVMNGPVSTRDSRHHADQAWITDDEVGRVVTELVVAGTTTWSALRVDGPLIVMNPPQRESS